ncbi:hypothetical protein Zm00014a_034868 [Zea mays]|uniref:Uncharacterized protein n=1 Tax=Zea mays TaxID=4577 RepID=A0A3L6EDX6_MAIZE|nr:hypothetical protein Zm00014a_034868 [Zea mays]
MDSTRSSDRDTRPEYIIKRIAQWIPPGRTYSLHQMKELQASFPLYQTVHFWVSTSMCAYLKCLIIHLATIQTCRTHPFSNLMAWHGQLIKPEAGIVVFAVIAEAI